jgi:beta-lactamase regulating signal transducer with metallopeptidase domain
MLAHLIDVSIRSLLLAIAAAGALWILRNRRTAALQHAVWTMVVSVMLALFAFGQAMPRLPLRILTRADAPAQTTAPAVVRDPLTLEENLPAAKQHSLSRAETRGRVDWREVAVGAYGAIAVAFLAQFVTGMFLVRKLLATAHPISCPGVKDVYESDRIAVPFTVGWVRPRILLPTNWREWERTKLDAVLAHEGAHVRRHDGVVAALAGLNRCVFWFHPLAWMLQRKLALLAEQACDESCVSELGDREAYARLLLEMASVVDPSRGRLRHHAVTMAAGPHIRQRIDALLETRRRFSRGLTWKGWAAVLVCGTPVVLGAAAVELDRQRPSLRLEMTRSAPPAPPLLVPPAIVGQTPPTPS